MPRGGIVGSHGNSSFKFLRNLYSVFCFPAPIYRPINSIGGFSIHPSLFSTSSPAFVICGLFQDGHSDGCEVVLIIVLIRIPPIITDVEHLLMCLSAICMSSLEKCLFRSSVHFPTELFVLLLLSYMSCLYIVGIKPLSAALLTDSFSQSVGCLFVLFMVSFVVQKSVSLIRSHLLIFASISIALGA